MCLATVSNGKPSNFPNEILFIHRERSRAFYDFNQENKRIICCFSFGCFDNDRTMWNEIKRAVSHWTLNALQWTKYLHSKKYWKQNSFINNWEILFCLSFYLKSWESGIPFEYHQVNVNFHPSKRVWMISIEHTHNANESEECVDTKKTKKKKIKNDDDDWLQIFVSYII